MIEPTELIGLPFRLGANPEKHGAADCLSMSKAVLHWCGIDSPEPTRSWYRRLKRKDYVIFREELERWGVEVSTAKLGTVGLGQGTANSCGLVVFYENGWLHFNHESKISWAPLSVLIPVALYSRSR